MPRRRAAGSVPTPITSATPAASWCEPAPSGPVGGLGDRHRRQPAAQPLAQEAEVAELRAVARGSRRLPARVARRRSRLRRESELDDRLRGRQRRVVGAEHPQPSRRPARPAATSRGLASASSGTCSTSSPAARAAPASDGVVSCTHSSASRTPSSRWRARSAATSSAPTSALEPEPRAPVEAPRDARDEQRQRAVLLDVGRRPRRRVEVRLDPLQQAGVRRRPPAHVGAAEPAAILRRSSASSSVASSTPCSRATSRSVRPLAEASLTISVALS